MERFANKKRHRAKPYFKKLKEDFSIKKNKPFISFSFQEAHLSHLKKGKILAYPTETLWGLGVDALNQKAVEALFKLKKRQKQKSISVLVRDIRMAKEFVFMSLATERLFQILTPGPFTFVLPIKNRSIPLLSFSNDFLGIRLSSHPFVTHMVWSYKNPITTTSANISGEKKLLPEVFKKHPNVLFVEPQTKIFDASREKRNYPSSALRLSSTSSSENASTVIKIRASSFSILRKGKFDMNMLSKILNSLGFNPEK